MKTPIISLAVVALLGSFSQAQQASTFQPSPQQITAPCNTPAPTPPHKQGWLEKKARDLACRQNKNLCDIPSSPDDITGTPAAAKPCTQTPTPKPPTPPAPPAPQKPAASNARPAYVCPPKATLVPNMPFCMYPDLTVIDAIPVPAVAAAPKQ